ncbi:DNA helicase [Microbacterium sp. G2-8]|uniref:DNA helicase n=1 Tax=Microbacterium sp. G2-8 TaxID=2842454 RepID=UPI001C896893|nr:DNA helicase [Microbacterium sp. G2-8]
MSLSLSKKRKKELRKLQGTVNKVLEAQRSVAADAADMAREAGRQLSAINSETIRPEASKKYHEYVEPYVERAQPYVEKGYRSSSKFFNGTVIPAAGGVIGRAIGAYDATASKLGKKTIVVEPPKKKSSAGAVIAAVLGIAAAVGIFVVAWKTLSADDELWVADEAVAAPDA